MDKNIHNALFNSAYGGITVASYLDDRRQTQDGKFPVKIRVTYRRERKYYSTGKKASQEEWDCMSTTKSVKFISIKSDIQASFKIIDDIVQELFRDDCFSFESLNIRLSKGTNDTVNTAFKAKISSLENEGRAGTQLYYNSVLNSITAICGEQIKFSDITANWLRNYERHLLKEDKTYTTVGIYMRGIRAIINEAKQSGIVKESQYPFGKSRYEIPTSEGRKLALTMQQIKTVVTYTDGREATERYRDLWFFSYLCNCINFTDMQI